MKNEVVLVLVLINIIQIPIVLAGKKPTEDECICDIKNKIHLVRLTTTEQEHNMRVPPEFKIHINFCPNPVFRRQLGIGSSTPLGSWNISSDGNIYFNHKPHKTGKAMFNISIDEVRGVNCSVETYFELTINEEADFPFVFASHHGISKNLTRYNNISDHLKRVKYTVEQDTGHNVAYEDLFFTTGVFDYDKNEQVQVTLENPGKIRGSVWNMNFTNSSVLLEPDDCHERQTNRSWDDWDTELTDTYPCGLQLPYPAHELSWFTNLVAYKPERRFYGIDEVILVFRDKYGLEAKLYVDIHVLENPCINEGRCRGPIWDKSCSSTNRSLGFFRSGYLCQCEDGWVGNICQTDFDDCSSSPCPPPRLCRDKFRGYECVCPPNLENCDPPLHMWHIGLIMVLVGFVVSAVIISLVAYSTKKLRHNMKSVAPSVEMTAEEKRNMKLKAKRIAEILKQGKKLRRIKENILEETAQEESNFEDKKPNQETSHLTIIHEEE